MMADLSGLFADQAGLDARIHAEHRLDYPSTRRRRLLALTVELGELANETRTFKFWSLKGPSPKSAILEEYADGLHFILSLGIDLGVKNQSFEIGVSALSLTEQFLGLYSSISLLSEHFDEGHYRLAMTLFLGLIPSIGATLEEAIAAYHAKLQVNYQRQDAHY